MAAEPLDSTAMRVEYAEWLCTTWAAGSKLKRVVFPGPDREWALLVAPPTAPAWEVFAEVMAVHGYLFRESAGGTFNPRPISGTHVWSLHAYGLAIDLNPSENGPQGSTKTDQPASFRNAIKSITAKGRRVFVWGGDWSSTRVDPMHWQIGATAAEIADGVTWEDDDVPLNDADLLKIRNIVSEEVDALLKTGDDKTSRLSRNIAQHGGAFTGPDDPGDNWQRTAKRTEEMVKRIEGYTKPK